MKKYLALAVGVLFTLGFAVSAFAITAEIPAETQAVVAEGATRITLGGELEFGGEMRSNISNLVTIDNYDENYPIPSTVWDKNETGKSSAYEGRVRIRLQADVSKNTQGVIHLESGTNASDVYTWGAESGGTGIYGEGNAKRGTLSILEAWIQHKFDIGVPAGIKVGHMPIKLGQGLFLDHSTFGDDAIVLFMDPTKELHVGLLTAKFAEGNNDAQDDSDAYVGLFVYSPSKGTSISGDVTYLDAKLWPDDTIGNRDDKGTHLWNVGLRGNTTVSNLTIRGDVELQTGKLRFQDNFLDTNNDGVEDANAIKFKGYAYLVGLDYKVAPVTLTLEHAYGSGTACDDANNDGYCDDKADLKTFVTSLGGYGDQPRYTYVYDYRTATAGGVGETYGAAGTGIANTWYVKLGMGADLTKDLNALVNVYYLRASKAVAINMARDPNTGQLKTSKNIGTEVDAKIEYKINKNLKYFVEGGYLFAGSAYDYNDLVAPHNTKGANDAYAVRHGITLSF